jgi:hypothetical protein
MNLKFIIHRSQFYKNRFSLYTLEGLKLICLPFHNLYLNIEEYQENPAFYRKNKLFKKGHMLLTQLINLNSTDKTTARLINKAAYYYLQMTDDPIFNDIKINLKQEIQRLRQPLSLVQEQRLNELLQALNQEFNKALFNVQKEPLDANC